MLYLAIHVEQRINVDELDFRKVRRYAKALEKLSEKGDEPSIESLAEVLDWDVEDVLQTKTDHATENFISFEDLATEENGLIEYPIEDKGESFLEDFCAGQSYEILLTRLKLVIKPQ